MNRNDEVQAFLDCSDAFLDYNTAGDQLGFMAKSLIAEIVSDGCAFPKPIYLSSCNSSNVLKKAKDLGRSAKPHSQRTKPYDYLDASSIVFALRSVSGDKKTDAKFEEKSSCDGARLDWFCWLAENKSWLAVGFSDGRLTYRGSQSNIQHELLLKALRGRKKSEELGTVFDATAGLARDAWLMAAAGFRVEAVERVGLLSTMLRQSLKLNMDTDITANLNISAGDSAQIMADGGASQYDIVYLDPMYDSGLKPTAAVKNEMFFLRKMTSWFDERHANGASILNETKVRPLCLLELARNFAKRKVVVKRAPKAPYLSDVAPASSLTAKAVRFDIYPC